MSKLAYWESLCDSRPDFHHHFDASVTSNAICDKLAERPAISTLAGAKQSYAKLAVVKFSRFFAVVEWQITQLGILMLM